MEGGSKSILVLSLCIYTCSRDCIIIIARDTSSEQCTRFQQTVWVNKQCIVDSMLASVYYIAIYKCELRIGWIVSIIEALMVNL